MKTQDFHLTRANTLAHLAALKRGQCSTTLYLRPGMTEASVQSHVDAAAGKSVPSGLVEIAQASATGACLFSGTVLTLILPPFPIIERAVFSGCEAGPLESMLYEEKDIAIVLVRLGRYALGVCHGEQLLSSKVGTGLVHARQRQGGSSSQRFRRRREKQIEQFLTRVCEKVHEHVVPYLSRLEFIVYGGAWTTIDLLKKQCPPLVRLTDRELPPLLDIGEPKQQVLEASARRVWSCRIIEWRRDDEVL